MGSLLGALGHVLLEGVLARLQTGHALVEQRGVLTIVASVAVWRMTRASTVHKRPHGPTALASTFFDSAQRQQAAKDICVGRPARASMEPDQQHTVIVCLVCKQPKHPRGAGGTVTVQSTAPQSRVVARPRVPIPQQPKGRWSAVAGPIGPVRRGDARRSTRRPRSVDTVLEQERSEVAAWRATSVRRTCFTGRARRIALGDPPRTGGPRRCVR